MRTTVNLDDELVARAGQLCGIRERSALLREALTALIERESARRLAKLGGSEPRAKAPPRRRPHAA
jgi:Arc/MetJ family transcription regulator